MRCSFIFLFIFFLEQSFAQHIEEIFVGRSLEKTIDQGRYKGHEFLEVNENVASFCVVSQFGKARLSLHASPKSNTVWFGTSRYWADSKVQLKENFEKMKKSLIEKYGMPDKIKRKEVSWVLENYIVILKRSRYSNDYSVVSTVAYKNIASEF